MLFDQAHEFIQSRALKVESAGGLTDDVSDVQSQVRRETLQYLDLPVKLSLIWLVSTSVNYSMVNLISPLHALAVSAAGDGVSGSYVT